MAGNLNGITSVGGRALTYGGPYNILPATAIDLKRSGRYRKTVISVMTGVTKHDGSFLAQRKRDA